MDRLRSGNPLPDVVFPDLKMPKMDGGECLRGIRSDERPDTVCPVIYSTVVDLDRIGELFGAGANRYLKKPSSFRALKIALDNAIESVRDNPLGGHTVINCSE